MSAMDIYENILAKVVAASGDGHSYRQSNKQLDFKLREDEVYAFYCSDDKNYYKTLMLKKMAINDTLKPLIGNPVYGVVPDGIQVIEPEQVYNIFNSTMREHSLTNPMEQDNETI